jgi:prepilin peptidase CpaA
MLDLFAIGAFAGLLIFAAAADIARYTIPNWVSLALGGVFVIAAAFTQTPLAQIGAHLAFGFGVLVVGFFLFQAGVFGGGDAKLLAAASVWTGFAAFPTFLFWTALAGGALALALLAARQFVKQGDAQPPFVNQLLTKAQGIPYGVAIMTGGLIAIPTLPLFTTALTTP